MNHIKEIRTDIHVGDKGANMSRMILKANSAGEIYIAVSDEAVYDQDFTDHRTSIAQIIQMIDLMQEFVEETRNLIDQYGGKA
jgi:t-SNARE complex subunit (syntaxin)